MNLVTSCQLLTDQRNKSPTASIYMYFCIYYSLAPASAAKLQFERTLLFSVVFLETFSFNSLLKKRQGLVLSSPFTLKNKKLTPHVSPIGQLRYWLARWPANSRTQPRPFDIYLESKFAYQDPIWFKTLNYFYIYYYYFMTDC